jgi:hypothetical protein
VPHLQEGLQEVDDIGQRHFEPRWRGQDFGDFEDSGERNLAQRHDRGGTVCLRPFEHRRSGMHDGVSVVMNILPGTPFDFRNIVLYLASDVAPNLLAWPQKITP